MYRYCNPDPFGFRCKFGIKIRIMATTASIKKAYQLAKDQYKSLKVNTDAALEKMKACTAGSRMTWAGLKPPVPN
jgi:hypothetical protein